MAPIRILIVEDEPPIARYLQQILAAKKYNVSGIAYDTTEAYDKLGMGLTDLVLLDINLNGRFSGIDIAESLSTKFQIPFIFITSYADEDTLAAAKIFNPLGFIVKPFSEEEIYASIEIGWHNYTKQTRSHLSLEYINSKVAEPLTTREYVILQEVIKGAPYKDIAQKHHISINTASTHIKNLFTKLRVHSRGELTEFIRQL